MDGSKEGETESGHQKTKGMQPVSSGWGKRESKGGREAGRSEEELNEERKEGVKKGRR